MYVEVLVGGLRVQSWVQHLTEQLTTFPKDWDVVLGILKVSHFHVLNLENEMLRISFKMGATEAKETAFGKKIDENVQAMLCPTNFNLLLANKERSHKLNSHTGGNWPQDLS